jgi:protein gp37
MSKIEWTEKTINCVTGCAHISPGCQNCYAEKMTKRLKAMGQKKYANGFDVVTCHPGVLLQLNPEQKPTVYFVNSMSDTFHKEVPESFLSKLYATMMRCRQHKFIILTKRADRMAHFFSPENCFRRPNLENIIHGVTVCNQDEANRKVPLLLRVPSLRFLSMEPLIGPVDLTKIVLKKSDAADRSKPDVTINALKGWHGGIDRDDASRIHQVITGGESGHGARPMNPHWPRKIAADCKAAGAPYMHKQNGMWEEFSFADIKRGDICVAMDYYGNIISPDDRFDSVMGDVLMRKTTKKIAGRLLDGKIHNELIWNQ